LMLLDPDTWSLAQSSDEVIVRLSEELSAHTSPETHASVIELKTGVHTDVDGVMGELASLRSRLADELGAMGLRAAGAGTHPRTDSPRFFSDYTQYVESVDALIAPGAIPDPSFSGGTRGCSRRSGLSRCG